eukprot:scaffold10.g2328.t1
MGDEPPADQQKQDEPCTAEAAAGAQTPAAAAATAQPAATDGRRPRGGGRPRSTGRGRASGGGGGLAMSAEEQQAWRQRLLGAYAAFRRALSQRQLWLEIPPATLAAGEALVGRAVRVLWDDGVWYLGTATAFDPATGLHTMAYADGTVEQAPLAADRVRLLLHAREPLAQPAPAALRAHAAALAALAAAPKHADRAEALRRRAGELAELAEAAAAEAEAAAAAVMACEGPQRAAPVQPGGVSRSSSAEGLQADLPPAAEDGVQQQPQQQQQVAAAAEAATGGGAGAAGGGGAAAEQARSSRQPGVAGQEEEAVRDTGEEADDAEESGLLLPGEVVWCKVTGFPDWPAIVITHEQAAANGYKAALSAANRKKVPLMFFGDYSSYCYLPRDITRFPEGVRTGHHARKSKKRAHFRRSMFEVESFCKDGELPPGMVPVHGDEGFEEESAEEAAAAAPRPGTKAKARRSGGGGKAAPAAAPAEGAVSKQLRVLDLGRVEWLHPAFHDEKHIWPVGYRAERLAATPASGGEEGPHVLEVAAAPDGSGPLFRRVVCIRPVTPPGGRTAVQARSASKAWAALHLGDKQAAAKLIGLSGAKMFGVSAPAVQHAIQGLPGAERCDRYCGWPEGQQLPEAPELTKSEWRRRLWYEAATYAAAALPPGARPVAAAPTPPGVCHVCNEEEETEDNICDKCRVFVHMECYGVKDDPRGRPWTCDVCTLGLRQPPPCALCPVQGGALKRTACRRWCHVACSVWAEEATLDQGANAHGVLQGAIRGLEDIHASRFRITCALCRQPHGACVQCCDPRCYAAFHPLCARQAPNCRIELVEDSDGEEEEEAEGQCREGSSPAADENDAAADNRPPPRRAPKRQRKEGYSVGAHRLLVFCPKHSGLDGDGGSGGKQRGRGGQPLPRGGAATSAAAGARAAAAEGACEAEPSTGRGAASAAELAAAASAAAAEAAPPVQQQAQVPAAGCARAVPFDFALRRGQRAPEAMAAAQAKRQYVRRVPYLVGGPRQQARPDVPPSSCTWLEPAAGPSAACVEAPEQAEEGEQEGQEQQAAAGQQPGSEEQLGGQASAAGTARGREGTPLTGLACEAAASVAATPPPAAAAAPTPTPQQQWRPQDEQRLEQLSPASPGAQPAPASLADRFAEMRRTLGERVTAGKSGIHGWGAFAKLPHHEGEMVIEYVGDLVRPSVADMRERLCYDSVVGAGTYIFRLGEEECVDATRAGNMAHLLNHSCDPNCYSRTISVEAAGAGAAAAGRSPGGGRGASNHVVIFAKRDIVPWEELTYDYRFSGEEQLRCNCGATSCRDRVNEPPRADGTQCCWQRQDSRPGTAEGGASRAVQKRCRCSQPPPPQGASALVVRRGLRTTPVTMALKTGIVGLPNVGKSTMFNALCENGKAQAANFPFCTIEPNVGVVAVPDPRLDELHRISASQKTVPTTVEFVDIAGLVKGASKGEGLGNQFLANIRECDSIVQARAGWVVRCFEDTDVVHVAGKVDPLDDTDVINFELALADITQIERRLERLKKTKGKSGDEAKRNEAEAAALGRIMDALEQGRPARSVALGEEEAELVRGLCLLTAKPMIYAANVAEEDLADPGSNPHVAALAAKADEEGSGVVVMSAQAWRALSSRSYSVVEAELTELDKEEAVEFLQARAGLWEVHTCCELDEKREFSLGVEEGGLKSLIRATYKQLGLLTYFTTGEKETRAWTIKEGFTAPQAAGVIHSDFEKGFIRAETVAYEDFVAAGGFGAAKEKGLMRLEGKEYVVKEGDIMVFRNGGAPHPQTHPGGYERAGGSTAIQCKSHFLPAGRTHMAPIASEARADSPRRAVSFDSCKLHLAEELPADKDPREIIKSFKSAINMSVDELEAFLASEESRQAASVGEDADRQGRHMARRHQVTTYLACHKAKAQGMGSDDAAQAALCSPEERYRLMNMGYDPCKETVSGPIKATGAGRASRL